MFTSPLALSVFDVICKAIGLSLVDWSGEARSKVEILLAVHFYIGDNTSDMSVCSSLFGHHYGNTNLPPSKWI